MQQGRSIVTTLLQTCILHSATRPYLFTKFRDEHAKPMEDDTTLLHSILINVFIYANLCTIARTILLFRHDNIKSYANLISVHIKPNILDVSSIYVRLCFSWICSAKQRLLTRARTHTLYIWHLWGTSLSSLL